MRQAASGQGEEVITVDSVKEKTEDAYRKREQTKTLQRPHSVRETKRTGDYHIQAYSSKIPGEHGNPGSIRKKADKRRRKTAVKGPLPCHETSMYELKQIVQKIVFLRRTDTVRNRKTIFMKCRIDFAREFHDRAEDRWQQPFGCFP